MHACVYLCVNVIDMLACLFFVQLYAGLNMLAFECLPVVCLKAVLFSLLFNSLHSPSVSAFSILKLTNDMLHPTF